MAKRVDKETKLLQYGDDTVILTLASIDESMAKLEQKANKLIQHLHELQMTLNTSKTEFMIIGKSKKENL